LESTTNVLIELKDYLDLVAIGTVADMATLLGENRSLVKKGIQVIQQGRRQGILSLAGVAGLQPGAVTATEIGYLLGPRLNAAGRLETAQDALKLLMTADTHEAGILAQKLNNQNRERQDLTQKIQEHALQQAVARDPQALILFAVHPEYNPGVVGLAASRLTERYYRPAIVGHMDGQFVRASCRSIPEFHITNALDECANLLVRYGGHAAAAGFTAKNEDMPALIERLNSIARRELQAIELQPKLYADMVMELKDLKPAVLQEINLIQPTGIGNPPVLFVSRDLKVMRAWTAGKDAAHLKLTLTDGYVVFDGIGFRLGYVKDQLPSKVDVLYSFEVNEYNGNRNFQLNIKDIRASQG
jgi:single-stranded-DNA-specific exonuclease